LASGKISQFTTRQIFGTLVLENQQDATLKKSKFEKQTVRWCEFRKTAQKKKNEFQK